MRHWGQHCSLTMAAAMTLTAPKTPPPLTTTSTRSKSTSNWPKVAAILLNASGQLGYHCMPASINRKLTALLNTKTNNKNSNNSYDSNRSVETIISEMIFGSVALNFCARNASKIHRLSDDLYMNSFIVQIDVTNGKTVQHKFGLALIWDVNEFNGQLRQLFLKESVIMDSLINEFKNDLVKSRIKNGTDIHKCFTKFLTAINDYLSVCRLSCSISDDQFVDELIALITKYDTKGTHFFVSTLLTSILMFKYKSYKMKLILWSNDVNKISFVSQLLVVINQFLESDTKKISYLAPQLKSIKFCRDLTAMQRTSSVTPLTKSVISERKSRDESLGYESLTESGSSTTSTVCDYNGFGSKSLDSSTPLQRSLEHSRTSSVERLKPELVVDASQHRNQSPSSSQLNKSRNYFREYHNLRFTSNQSSEDSNDEDSDSNMISPNNYRLSEELSDTDSHNYSNSPKSDEFGTEATDIEEIYESHLLSGFGHISLPQLIPDISDNTNEISLSQTPSISDTYLSQLSVQGIVNSKTISSFDDLVSDCLKRSSNTSLDDTIIVCDCDSWRISCVESSRHWPAIMSSFIGNLCESIAELHSLSMNSQLIRRYIDNKMNDLKVKSLVVKSLIESECTDSRNKQNLMKLFDRDSKQSLFNLIADNYFNELSSTECLNLGFDVSDIPVIIALNRHSMTKTHNNCKNSDRNEIHLTETFL